MFALLVGFSASTLVRNCTEGLSTEGAVGPPTAQLSMDLVEAASVEVWRSVAAVSRQSTGHCCSHPEPSLAPGV